MLRDLQNSQVLLCLGSSTNLSLHHGRPQPEKAQTAVEGADRGYRDLRIENSLTDEHGDEVRLKKGAHAEIAVTAEDVSDN